MEATVLDIALGNVKNQRKNSLTIRKKIKSFFSLLC